MNCSRCQSTLEKNTFKCKSCGQWNAVKDHNDPKSKTILLSDVEGDTKNRIQTGPWDKCFGTDYETGVSGIVTGSTTLIGGSPGAGKSTLFLQIANSAAATTDKEVLYLATEEQLKQIKDRGKRLQLGMMNKIRMCEAMTGEAPSLVELIELHKPGLVLLDSLNAMTGEDLIMAVTICKLLKQACMKYDIPALISSHVTKGGELAGLEKLQHEVDSTMTFFPDEQGNEAPRILHVEKNRNGRAFIQQAFLMTETGLVSVEEGSEELEDA